MQGVRRCVVRSYITLCFVLYYHHFSFLHAQFTQIFRFYESTRCHWTVQFLIDESFVSRHRNESFLFKINYDRRSISSLSALAFLQRYNWKRGILYFVKRTAETGISNGSESKKTLRKGKAMNFESIKGGIALVRACVRCVALRCVLRGCVRRANTRRGEILNRRESHVSKIIGFL